MATIKGQLTQKQKAYIEAHLANPILPISAICEQIGISPSTVYMWKSQQPHVFEEIDRRLKAKWEHAAAMAQETMESLAREGNFNAAKYILDSNGYAAPQNINLNTESTVTININED